VSLCWVHPDAIRPVLRKRATEWEPGVWMVKQWWRADRGTLTGNRVGTTPRIHARADEARRSAAWRRRPGQAAALLVSPRPRAKSRTSSGSGPAVLAHRSGFVLPTRCRPEQCKQPLTLSSRRMKFSATASLCTEIRLCDTANGRFAWAINSSSRPIWSVYRSSFH